MIPVFERPLLSGWIHPCSAEDIRERSSWGKRTRADTCGNGEDRLPPDRRDPCGSNLGVARDDWQAQVESRRSDDPVGHVGDEIARDLPHCLRHPLVEGKQGEAALSGARAAQEMIQYPWSQSSLFDEVTDLHD